MSAPYAAPYAELYDLFYRDKPYAREVHLIDRLLREHGVKRCGRVLELACGTGEHAAGLAARGYRVTATDGSRAMIELARKKAARRKIEIMFVQRDMRKSCGAHRAFDAALCLFDSIGYVQSNAGIGGVLKSVHDSLRPGGVFIVEFWHAPAMLKSFEPVRVRRFHDGASDVLRISETTLDRRRSLAHVDYNVYRLHADSTYDHLAERHTNRFFTVPEMTKLAQAHGFKRVRVYAGFSRRAVSDRTWHVLAVLQRDRKDAEVAAKRRSA